MHAATRKRITNNEFKTGWAPTFPCRYPLNFSDFKFTVWVLSFVSSSDYLFSNNLLLLQLFWNSFNFMRRSALLSETQFRYTTASIIVFHFCTVIVPIMILIISFIILLVPEIIRTNRDAIKYTGFTEILQRGLRIRVYN